MKFKIINFMVILNLLFIICTIVEAAKNVKKMDAEGTAGLVPTPPANTLEITYDTKKVELGNELTPTDVKNPPTLITWEAVPESFYTLIMVDPDAPSRKIPLASNVNHWLVTNIHGNDLATGEIIADYSGSGPPKHTGLHRYIFFVFKQPSKLEFNEPKTGPLSRQHRLKFPLKNFIKKYNLGDPVAGNYFKAKWDSYVDVKNKEIENCTIV